MSENNRQIIELPRCPKCRALQIELLKMPFDKCIHCDSELENVKFKEI